MNELVEIKSNQAVCSSIDVAEAFGKRHDNVLRLIESLVGGLLTCEETPDMFKKSFRSDKQNGQRYPIYYMNRDGFSLLVMSFKGEKALKWKLKYIEAFNTMEQLLSEQKTAAWIETRKQSKLTRNSETDMIQRFVEYAKESGSKNAEKYYIIFSRLANKRAGILDRDNATTFQLNSLVFIESAILKCIEKGIEDGLEYHAIYERAKETIDNFEAIVGYEDISNGYQRYKIAKG